MARSIEKYALDCRYIAEMLSSTDVRAEMMSKAAKQPLEYLGVYLGGVYGVNERRKW
jgi:hypothetical protein